MKSTGNGFARFESRRVALVLVVLVIITLTWSGRTEVMLVALALPLLKDLAIRSLPECPTCQA